MCRRTVRAFVILLLLYTSFCLGAGVFVANTTLHPQRRILTPPDPVVSTQAADALPQDISITSSDGLVLRGWILRSKNPNGDAVLLLHGLSDNRLGMLGYARLLLHHGYSVVLPDSRAHGASDGTLATYGLLEADDIYRWVERIQNIEHPGCVFGFGESMGAAQLLQSLRNEPAFCAVAAESPFASFREIAYDRVGQYFQTGPWLGRTLLRPIVEVAFAYAKHKCGFDFAQLSPQVSVSTTPIPVFLIHGANDSNIPIRHSRLIKASNAKVKLWEVPHTDHCGGISTHPEEFESQLVAWYKSHTTPVEPNLKARVETRHPEFSVFQ